MISLTSEQKQRLNRVNIIRLLVFLGLLTAIISLMVLVDNLFICLLLAFIISYLIRPLIFQLEKAGLGYNLSLVSIFLVGFITIILTGIWIFPFISEQVLTLQKEWPRYFTGLVSLIDDMEQKIQNFTSVHINLKDIAEKKLVFYGQKILKDFPSLFLQGISILLLAPFLAFFILKDGHKIFKRFMVLVPNNLFEMVVELQHKINQQLGLFIRARFLEAFIVGLFTFIGLSVISFPFAALLGGFAGLTNLIPYIGPIVGAIPAIIIALVNDYHALDLTIVIGVYFIAQLIDNGILIPILVARIVNLHPVTVVLLVILGGQFMGILGMIIIIPLANALKVTFLSVYEHLTRFKN